MSDDLEEFVAASSQRPASPSAGPKSRPDDYHADIEKDKNAGKSTQWAAYGPGYTSTNDTIKTLPAGCYDIKSDDKCAFVEATLKPSGLLLQLPEMRSEDVIKVIDRFWESEADYKQGNKYVVGGAAYKAGLMLWGPPGSGKSCTLKIACNKLVERGGIVFYASGNPKLVAAFLAEFASIEHDRKCIVVLEDIDSLIDTYGETHYLEMLDSAKTINNVLFIATTNYPDRLDPRIYNRPGRFSHVIKIGLPTAKAREAYLKAILKDHSDVPTIVDKSDGFTIDHLTSLVNAVYREHKDINDELRRLRTLFRIPKPNDNPIGIGVKADIP